MLALDAGVRAAVDEIAAGGGRRVLTVVAGRVDAPPGRGVGSFVSTQLDLDDVAALRADVGGERRVAPIAERPAPREARQPRSRDVGARRDAGVFRAPRFRGRARRLTDELDGAVLGRVAVVGSLVAAKLGGSTLGESVSIGGVPFTVIGELERQGVAADGTNQDDQISCPCKPRNGGCSTHVS